MILTIDTSLSNKTEIRLFDEDFKLLSKSEFLNHNNLSETLLSFIDKALSENKLNKNDLTALIAYHGPGSYTGLRIGITTANFIAYSLNIPILAFEGDINNQKDLKRLIAQLKVQDKRFNNPIVPFYKSPPHITKNKYCLY